MVCKACHSVEIVVQAQQPAAQGRCKNEFEWFVESDKAPPSQSNTHTVIEYERKNAQVLPLFNYTMIGEQCTLATK